jgi:hypothetical protein
LTYEWLTPEFLWSQLEHYQLQVILALCVATFLAHILILVAFSRGKRLRNRVDKLQLSIQRLSNIEDMRLLKEIRGQQKDKTQD